MNRTAPHRNSVKHPTPRRRPHFCTSLENGLLMPITELVTTPKANVPRNTLTTLVYPRQTQHPILQMRHHFCRPFKDGLLLPITGRVTTSKARLLKLAPINLVDSRRNECPVVNGFSWYWTSPPQQMLSSFSGHTISNPTTVYTF
jgi:hypothetical protein